VPFGATRCIVVTDTLTSVNTAQLTVQQCHNAELIDIGSDASGMASQQGQELQLPCSKF